MALNFVGPKIIRIIIADFWFSEMLQIIIYIPVFIPSPLNMVSDFNTVNKPTFNNYNNALIVAFQQNFNLTTNVREISTPKIISHELNRFNPLTFIIKLHL